MSALAHRSALVLALLFGLVFAVGTGVMYYLEVPLAFALLFAVLIVLFQYLIGPWIIDYLFHIDWVQPESIHPQFAQWYRETCASRKIPVPRLGVIRDGNPNAFTYGHTPKDARVVVTSGLLEMLDAEETHAVVAHEIGHVAHNDFIVMTVAQVVPIMLYYLYVWTRHRARDNREAYALAVAIGAYVAYIASEYIVLFLSRVREYFADEASAQTMRNPNALSTALVKIAYGLARNPRAAQEARAAAEAGGKDTDKKKNGLVFDPGRASAALGICNAVAAGNFALTSANADGAFSSEKMTQAMQWDLKNPWGKWFELNSTHPLTARRILAMNRIARRMGIDPTYSIDPAGVHKVYTGNFALEFVLFALPLLGALAGAAVGYAMPVLAVSGSYVPLALLGGGLGFLIKIAATYPSAKGPARTVESLVAEEINVSQVRPLPCAVEGTIIGRGVPGLFFSDDLVLHDGTGFITILYRQPFGILEFLFGWLKAGHYMNRRARVHGWYRRAPVPYLEISRVEMLDGPDGNVRCYYKWGLYFTAIIAIVAGLGLLQVGYWMNFLPW